MKHIKRLIGILCLMLLTGCASNQEEVVVKQEEVAQQERIDEEKLTLNKDEEAEVKEEEIVIEGITYRIKRDYASSAINNNQLLRMEADGEWVVLDEGINIQIMRRGSSLYTCICKMVGEESECYIKKYIGGLDDEGELILEDIVNFQNAIDIKGHSSGRGLWCVVEERSNRVIILNEDDEVVFEQVLELGTDEELRLEPYAWSYGCKYLWCLSLGTYNVVYYTIIDTENFNVTQIKKEQPYQDDYAIDCNNGWVAYSNMPVIFDVDGRDEFMASGQEVTLYLENLFSKEKITVDTSVTKAFNPKWADKYTLQYDNPDGEGYLTYALPLVSDLDHLGEVVSILLESTEFLIECKEDTKRLDEESVTEITRNIIERLEEAQTILDTYEFHLKDSRLQEAIAYLERTTSTLLQEATLINEGRIQEALLDIHEIEEQVIEVGNHANSLIDPTY